MEIKPFILLISIFYLLHSSFSIRPEASNANSSTPESPDGTSSTPEAPDADDSSPESPYASLDKSPLPPAEAPSATFSFASNPAGNNSITSPELEKICKTTQHPVECVKYAALFLNDSVKIEPLTVLTTTIRASNEMTRQAIDTATKLANESGAADNLKTAMSTCLANYQTIPDDNNLAVQALDKQNPKEASFKLSSTVTSMDTCFDGISQMHITSPMRDMEAELQKLLSINLQLVSGMLKS
ncbi:hypothetical protein HRI_000617300 [Hibiscus trionum]|uniref:Pectinesterase inhibitor domain-containing protein n=1 Tax=Hibiscus trionum TaxID=183268 RepID=A0A9W7H1R3_HIBTR|nr:hypothetical protein HRI_000617300 [Hibiscus trionum]